LNKRRLGKMHFQNLEIKAEVGKHKLGKKFEMMNNVIMRQNYVALKNSKPS